MSEPQDQLATDVVTDSVSSFRLAAPTTALALIDMQYASTHRSTGLGRRLDQVGVSEEAAAYRFDRLESLVVPNLERLLGHFRDQGLTVIHVRLGSSVRGCRDLSPYIRQVESVIENYTENREFEFLEELAPVPGEPVVTKLSASAFTSSHLDALLKNLGVRQLVLGGVSTGHCVGLTAYDAADHGYDTVVVEDGCAEDTPELHSLSLKLFETLFGRVATVDEVVAELSPGAVEGGRGAPDERPRPVDTMRGEEARG